MSPPKSQLALASESLISLSEAAKFTPYSAEYLGYLVRRGKIEAIKMSRDWMTTREIVVAYVQEQEKRQRKLFEKFQRLNLEKVQDYGGGQSGIKPQSGFAAVGLLIMLGLAIASASALVKQGYNPFVAANTPAAQQLLAFLPPPLPTIAQSQSSFKQPGQTCLGCSSKHGQVLGASTSVSQDLSTLVNQSLQAMLGQGLLTGPPGPPGPAGPQGPQGLASVSDHGNGNTTSVIGGEPIVSYYPSQPQNNFPPESIAAFTNLSSQGFVSQTANIQNALTAGSASISGGASIGGSLSAGATNLSSLTVYGNVNLTGSTTIAGLNVTGFNPGFNQGSVAFQNGTALAQDNSNFFYDSTNHRLGIGTSTPSQLLTIAGNMSLTGSLFDSSNASGSLGMLLETTGGGTEWVATSTLGIAGGIGLPGGINAQLQFNKSGVLGGANFYYNGSNSFGINSTSPIANFVVQGTSTAATLPEFVVSSSTGASNFSVSATGTVTFAAGTGAVSGSFPAPTLRDFISLKDFSPAANVTYNGLATTTVASSTIIMSGLSAANVGQTIVVMALGTTSTFQSIITGVNGSNVSVASPVPFSGAGVGGGGVTVHGGNSTGNFAFYGTDDTTAINNAVNAARLANKCLYIPAGNYMYNAQNATTWTDPCIYGEGQNESNIWQTPGSYFLGGTAQWTSVILEYMSFFGGSGVIDNQYPGAGAGGDTRYVNDNGFENYTGCVIQTGQQDDSYWTVLNNYFHGSNSITTMGYCSQNIDASNFENNSFFSNAYALKIDSEGQGEMKIENNDFINPSENPQGSNVRAAVWLVPGALGGYGNSGVYLLNNKFGLEGLDPKDVRILISDTATTSATDYFGNTLPTLAASNDYAAGIQMSGGTVNQPAQSQDPGDFPGTNPVIYSYTPNVTNLNITTSFNNLPNYLIYFDPSVLPLTNSQLNQNDIFGPMQFMYSNGSKQPLANLPISNVAGFGHAIDNSGIWNTQRSGVITPFTSGSEIGGYTDLGLPLINNFTIRNSPVSTDSKVSITDAGGGSDAIEYTVAVPTSTTFSDQLIGAFATPTLGTQDWLEFDAKQGSSNTFASMNANITEAFGTVVDDSNLIILNPTWTHYKIPFNVSYTPTNSLWVNFVFEATTSNSTVDIGRVRVYTAQEPLGGGVFDTPGFASAMVFGTTSATSLVSGNSLVVVSSSTGAGQFIVSNQGNVEIGTTTPTGIFSLQGSATFWSQPNFIGGALIGTSTVDSNASLVFGQTTSASNGNLPEIQQTSIDGVQQDLALSARSSTGGILFYTGNDGGGATTPNLGAGSNTAKLAITSAGNIGIGTTTPANLLSVVVATSTAQATQILNFNSFATSTLAAITAGGEYLANGIAPAGSGGFGFVGGANIGMFETSSQALSFQINGANQLSLTTSTFYPANGITTNQGNKVLTFNNPANLTNPNYLQVNAAASTSVPFISAQGNSSSNISIELLGKGSGGVGVNTSTISQSFVVQGNPAVDVFNVASSSGVSDLYVTSAGNIGIGTTTPSFLLTVGNNFSVNSGGAETDTNLTDSALISGDCIQAGTGGILQSASGACGSGTSYLTDSGNSLYNNIGYQLGINSSTPIANLVVEGTSSNSTLPIFVVASSTGQNLFNIQPNGNVGIGSTTPAYSLVNTGTTYSNDLITKSGPVVDVRSFGAKGDGVNDDGPAIQAAITAAQHNSTLLFPCAGSKNYIIDEPLSFANTYGLTLESSNVGNGYDQCRIDYMGSATTTAFNFTNAAYITINNLAFEAMNSSSPVSTVATFGRNPSSHFYGGLTAYNAYIGGYATDAVVYNVAYEGNSWYTPRFILDGGGAKYVYYTSTQDDFNLGNLASSTDLSNSFYSPILNDYSPTITPASSLVYISLQANGVYGMGHMIFENGNWGAVPGAASQGNATSSAITLGYSGSGSTDRLDLDIENIRAENVVNFLNILATNTTISSVTLKNNTLSPDTSNINQYMVNNQPSANDTLNNWDIENNDNSAFSGSISTTQYGAVNDSSISDHNSFTVSTSTNSYIWDQANNIVNFGTTSTTSNFSLQGSPGLNLFSLFPNSGGGNFVVNSTGNVGIGTTTPNQALVIQASANQNYLNISSSTGASVLYIPNTGNIGIGTSTAISAALTLNGSEALVGSSTTIFMGTHGAAAPGSGSAGEKIQLYGGSNFNAAAGDYAIGVQGSNEWFNTAAGGGFIWYQNAVQKMELSTNGGFGYNTTTPASNFSIEGLSGSTTPEFIVASSSNAVNLIVTSTGNVGIGTATPPQTLTIQGSGTSDIFNITSSSGASDLYVTSAGNIGIGTTSPSASLQIQAGSGVTPFKIASSTGIGLLTLDTAGDLTTSGAMQANGSPDVSENVIVSDPTIAAGDVVMIDNSYSPPSSTSTDIYDQFAVTKATSTGDVLGVISTSPGLLINANPNVPADASIAPLTLAGRVPVNVSNENGNILAGDYLAASPDMPGYAVKATSSGEVIGQALGNFNPLRGQSTSTVLALIKVGYQVIDQPASSSPWAADFANASNGLKTAMQDITNEAVHIFGGAIYAADGIFDRVFAKEVHTDMLCVGQTCVTQTQFLQMVQQAGVSGNINSNSPAPPTPSAGSGGSVAGGNNSDISPSPTPTPTPDEGAVLGDSTTTTATIPPTPTPTSVPSITPTPTPSSTPIPSPIPTVTPTPIPTPLPVATPVPTDPLAPVTPPAPPPDPVDSSVPPAGGS